MAEHVQAYIITLFEPLSGEEEANMYQAIQCICGVEHIARLSPAQEVNRITFATDVDEGE